MLFQMKHYLWSVLPLAFEDLFVCVSYARTHARWYPPRLKEDIRCSKDVIRGSFELLDVDAWNGTLSTGVTSTFIC